jgi:hypothetical protein
MYSIEGQSKLLTYTFWQMGFFLLLPDMSNPFLYSFRGAKVQWDHLGQDFEREFPFSKSSERGK